MIHSVAVLGAGVMGAQLAAHVANAGVPVLLLDVTARAAADGLARARRLTPDPAFTPHSWSRIRTGGFDTDLVHLAEADWIVEAIVEQLEPKRALLARVDGARRPGSIVSTNTSGLSVAEIAEGRSDDFRRHWLGTHVFNPPRYLPLLELVPGPDTAAAILETIATFADHRLGKGVVYASDTPAFIANHVGLYGLARILPLVASGAYTIEEVDAITGEAIGRPKSATFRTLDLAGLDVAAHTFDTLHTRLADPEARAAFATPPLVVRMLQAGRLGEKSGQGFYRRDRRADGSSDIRTLDVETLDYRAARTPDLPALATVAREPDAAARVRRLFAGDDRVGAFLRATLAPSLVYAAHVAPAIARSVDDVDRAMRWGFGWALGPFELADAIGVPAVLDATAAACPALLAHGTPSVWEPALARRSGRLREGLVPPAAPDVEILRRSCDEGRLLRRTRDASLVDLGDGVLCLALHGALPILRAEGIALLRSSLDEAARGFAALVIGQESPHFTAGADLRLVLAEAEAGRWNVLAGMIETFQQATAAVRAARVPVVVAPGGLTLGGGCEILLHADRVQAAAESYIGLPEAGVGLIPAGGGTKEMLARAMDGAGAGNDAGTPAPTGGVSGSGTSGTTASAGNAAAMLPMVQRVFETIGFARVSTSAPDALRLGYLRAQDGWTMRRDRLLHDAKAVALRRVAEGHVPRGERTGVRVGGDTIRAALSLGVHLALRAGRISEHDALIGRTLARVLAGGDLPHASVVPERHLLDLEREAFLSLAGTEPTRARIRHTLETGKPLRN